MAIALTGVGGAFTRLGKLFKILRAEHVLAGGDLATFFADASAALGTEYLLAAPLPDALVAAQAAASACGPTLQAAAQAVFCKMVNDDTPLADKADVELAMKEFVRQMTAAGASVPACTVSVAAAAVAGNTGTGNVVVTAYRGDGLTQQNLYAEVGELRFTGDAQARTATAGSEPWTWTGDYAPADAFGHDWPGYSGATASGQTVDSQLDASGNLLTNSGFETFTTTDVPDDWTFTSGTVTTNYGQELSVVHRGTSALKVIGDGATTVTFEQTLTTLRPNTLYAVNLWGRVSVAPAAGQLSIKLVDGSGATIADDQGSNNAYLSALLTNTSYAATSYVFRTPKALPSTVKLQLSVTGPLTAGRTLYLDSLALAEMTALYAGGPSAASFRGAADWQTNDRWTVTAANNRAGATYGSTWQTAFERNFQMNAKGLLLPYSGVPTVLDSLMTA